MNITNNNNDGHNVLTATKKGCANVFAWIDPEGTVCFQIENAIASFNGVNINITPADRKAMRDAVSELHND